MDRYVTVEEAKQHCRIETDEDDNYINDLIDVAQLQIESYLGKKLTELEDESSDTKIDKRIWHAIRILVDNYYENRGTTAFASVSELPYLCNLIDPLKYIRCKQGN